MDGLGELVDEGVDVLAPPVVAFQPPAGALVTKPAAVVGEAQLHARRRVRIEIIVEMDAIDVVTADDVEDDLDGVVACVRFPGIEPRVAAVLADELGLLAGDMVGRHGGVGLQPGAEGIEPGVEFQSMRMGLAHREGQRIPEGLRSLALVSAQEFRPGFVGGIVEGVAGRPDLEEQCVQVQAGCEFDEIAELGLLLGDRETGAAWPVDVLHRRHPRGAELPRDGGSACCGFPTARGAGGRQESLGQERIAGGAPAEAGG